MIISLRYGKSNCLQKVEDDEFVLVEHHGSKSIVTIVGYDGLKDNIYDNVHHLFDNVDEVLIEN